MNSELKTIIQSDINRGYGKSGPVKPYALKYVIAWRKAVYYGRKHPMGLFYRVILKNLSVKTGIQIPTDTKIGKGFFIAHFGTIIINPQVTIGDNVNIAPGVIIGKANRGDHKGVPTVGNKVWIGANSVIVGNITIEDDVLIAPGAYVNFNVPAHSIVIGNPGIIHKSENATEGYINNLV